MRRLSAILIFCCTTLHMLKGQALITPLPHTEGYLSLDDIWRINVVNPSATAIPVLLEVQVEGAHHELIFSATSVPFQLLQGSSQPIIRSQGTSFVYGQNNAAQIVRSTGKFPFGNYILCYRIKSTDGGTILGEYCQEEIIRPFSPTELASPMNAADISTKFPILTWKPPFPADRDAIQYSLRLVPKLPKQKPIEAIEKNAPLLIRTIIGSTFLPYPADATGLETGKTYAWQIATTVGDFDLGYTEVWEFTVNEGEAEKLLSIPAPAFRELQTVPDGTIDIITQKLRIEINNRWGAPNLVYGSVPPLTALDAIYYKIYPVGKQSNPINMTSSIVLLRGINKVTINLQGVSGIVSGEQYILVLKDVGGREFVHEFTYQN